MENCSKKIDRRIIKTKKAIRNSFAELLSEKDINDITIKDISDTADINRKTFYNYYGGIYQVIDEIENEIVSAFDAVISDVDYKRDMQNPYVIFSKLTAVINNDIDFYGHLMKMNNNAKLVTKIISTLKAKVRVSVSSQLEIDEQTLDLMLDYTISGMISVYKNWFNSGRKQSIEELSKIISVMAFSGFNGVLNSNT